MDDSPTHFSDPTTVEARRTSFGAGASTYDAVRPPWPGAPVDWMLGHPGDPVRVLDLGAGTGLGTRTVATLGHAVVAVDPSAEMLAALSVASERLDPEVAARVETRVGSAETLTDADATYDAVTAFQSWHWFDTERTVRECARVLRSGGWLSMAWHGWSDGVAWLRELGEVVGTPEMIWDAAAHAAREPDRLDGFERAENAQFAVEQRLTPDDLARLASSWSPVAVRDDRDRVLVDVQELGARAAGPDGTVLFPYVTDCYRYRRR